MPILYVLQGPDSGQAYRTRGEPLVLGRRSHHVSLSDGAASEHHAEIRPDNGCWVVVDLNSSDGTFVNGRRIMTPTLLRHGDRINLGSTLLFFDRRDQIESDAADWADFNPAELEIDESNTGLARDQSTPFSWIPLESTDVGGRMLSEAAEALASVDSIGLLLDRMSDVVFGRLSADRLGIWLVDPETRSFIPQAARVARVNNGGHRAKVVIPRSILNRIGESREGVLGSRTSREFPRASNDPDEHRNFLAAPILGRDGVVGALFLECATLRHNYTLQELRAVAAVGRVTGLAIEHLRLLEARARSARLVAVGETVAYLSHHIRNILQGMQGGAEVVELGFRRHNLETASDGWALVRRNLERTLHLAMNMLTFTKDRQPRVEPTDLNQLVEEVVGLVGRRLEEQGVAVQTDLRECPLPPLDADGMHQVVHNLVINAIEAVPRGSGRVTIRTRYDETRGEAVLSVEDNGPGIAPQDCKRIFDAFQSSKGQGGTGLGLAAAKKIVQEHHGRIEIESTVGQGATFHVRLPVKN